MTALKSLDKRLNQDTLMVLNTVKSGGADLAAEVHFLSRYSHSVDQFILDQMVIPGPQQKSTSAIPSYKTESHFLFIHPRLV